MRSLSWIIYPSHDQCLWNLPSSPILCTLHRGGELSHWVCFHTHPHPAAPGFAGGEEQFAASLNMSRTQSLEVRMKGEQHIFLLENFIKRENRNIYIFNIWEVEIKNWVFINEFTVYETPLSPVKTQSFALWPSFQPAWVKLPLRGSIICSDLF